MIFGLLIFPAIVYLLSSNGFSYVLVTAHHTSKGVVHLSSPSTAANLVPVNFLQRFGGVIFIRFPSNHSILIILLIHPFVSPCAKSLPFATPGYASAIYTRFSTRFFHSNPLCDKLSV